MPMGDDGSRPPDYLGGVIKWIIVIMVIMGGMWLLVGWLE